MPLRRASWVALWLATTLGLGGCGSEGGTDEPGDIAACLEEGGVGGVEVLDRERAEDVEALDGLTDDADGVVGGADSEDRPVYVVLFGSEREAREQRERAVGPGSPLVALAPCSSEQRRPADPRLLRPGGAAGTRESGGGGTALG